MKNYIPLSEQEELVLRQLAMQPGSLEIIFKLLQMTSLDAQADAIECTGSREERLMKLTDAQATAKVVSKLMQKLAAYREVTLMVPAEEEDELQQVMGDVWTRKEAN